MGSTDFVSGETVETGDIDFRQLVDGLQAGVVVHGPDTRILLANPHACELIGLTLAQLTGRDAVDPVWSFLREDGSVLPPADFPVRRVLDGLPVRDMVVGVRHASGEIRWGLVAAYPELGARGEIRLVVVTIVDLTDLRRAEESLRDSEERLRIAAEAADLGTWRHDEPTGIVRMDGRAAAIFGLEERAVPASTILARVHRYDVDRLQSQREAVFVAGTEGSRASIEFRIVLPGERVRWVSLHVQTHFESEEPGARPSFSIGTCQDVTGRKLAEEALFRTQKLEALGTLAGGVAHDFNNILLAIRGNAALALGDLPEGHPARRYLAEIDRAGVRAAGVVKQVLGFARPQPAEREVMPLTAPVEEALKLLRATIPALIELDARWSDGLPPVRVDAGQIQQAVVNLVKNAADAIGPRPGRVEIRVAAETIGTETGRMIAALDPGRYVKLTVSDDGPGMDRTTRDRAFDPFFTTKEAGGGTGLGLSIVHGILQAHGGAAAIESRPGQGAKVHLYFPAAEDAPSVAAGSVSEKEARIRTERLLFVDDDEALVFLANEMLGRLGYRVTAFDSPVEALEAFRADPDAFDGVISDISMPRMSGFALAAEILALRPAIPFVITSGYVRPEDEESAVRLGVRAVILKPNTVDEMAGTLDRIFRGGT